jgi:hypothetical protein
MPDFEALLLEEQKNPNVAILQFFQSQYGEEDVVVIVEGKDDPSFYYDFVAAYLPNQSLFFFPCGGKPALLKFKEFLSGYGLKPSPKKVLFLTDKDFDDFLEKPQAGVFRTELYSIENYFCCAEFFEYLLRRYGVGHVRPSRIPALKEQFSAALSAAAKTLSVPMAMICALKDQGVDLDLDAISCVDLVECNNEDGTIRKKVARAHIIEKTFVEDDPTYEIDCKLVRKHTRAFDLNDYNKWLRGKYGLQLMRLVTRSLGRRHPTLRDFLHRLSASFNGNDCFRYSKTFLGDIPTLKAYCEA